MQYTSSMNAILNIDITFLSEQNLYFEKFNMNRKIGILTLYYKNYNMGGLLQAYALQKAIANLGIDAEQLLIDYKKFEPISNNSSILDKIKRAYKNGFCSGCKFIASKVLCLPIEIYEKRKISLRIASYNAFAESIPHSSVVYTPENISDSLNKYDTFICGGDQIWNNWSFMNDDMINLFTLNFVGKDKVKFSYAASTGTASPSQEFLGKLKPGINSLDNVSVREASSIPYIEKIAGKQVSVMPDPVFLLDVKQWDRLADSYTVSLKDSYAFCYFLGNNNILKKEAEQFAHKVGLKSLVFVNIMNNFDRNCVNWGDIRDFTSGPGEFVNLIRNSKLVLTDSFHAIVFSMIFHKPFYAFDREGIVDGKSMNSRVTDLLFQYNLETRLISLEELQGKNKIDDIDYGKIDEQVRQVMEKGYRYIYNAIEPKM